MVYWCRGSTFWTLEGTRFQFLLSWVHLRHIQPIPIWLFHTHNLLVPSRKIRSFCPETRPSAFGSCRLAGGFSAKMPSSCDPINYLVATLIFASNIWILLKLLSSFMNHNFQHIFFCGGFPSYKQPELGKHHGLPHLRNGLTVEPRPVSGDEHVSQAGGWEMFVSTIYSC